MPKHDIDLTYPPVVINGYSLRKFHEMILIGSNCYVPRRMATVSLPLLKFMDYKRTISVVLRSKKHGLSHANRRPCIDHQGAATETLVSEG